MSAPVIMNKTMDLEDLSHPQAQVVVDELNTLVEQLSAKKLRISSWLGQFDLPGDPNSWEFINRGYGYEPLPGAPDDANFPWFLYWEIVWIVMNNEFRRGDRVLDLGGSSPLFSYCLASRGLDVTTIDLQENLVRNADHVAKHMGWKLKNFRMDMRKMCFEDTFDHITSISVYHTMPPRDRISVNKSITDLLTSHGKFCLTFDYRNPARSRHIASPDDIDKQFVKPSGLKMRGNDILYDNGKNYLLHPFYHPKTLRMTKMLCVAKGDFSPLELLRTKNSNDYTFAALFLQRGES